MRFILSCVVICLACLPVERAAAADAVAMIVDLIGRDDADYRQIGLDRVRHAAKGSDATLAFAGLLATQQQVLHLLAVLVQKAVLHQGRLAVELLGQYSYFCTGIIK